ncbi:hypothetical protein DL96DRAFT_1581423 [Flagelloscypha sp. PMI_526]|nr:hypothetical protein DL96DRAFT_1581423 [Flagelloscypha sp. PMI_526]
MGSPARPIFPDDIFGLFCLYLPQPDLKQCCLTSRTFRYFSRPRIFERLTIRNRTGEEPHGDDLKFFDALKSDPALGALVKSLKLLQADIYISPHWLTSNEIGSRLYYILTHLPNLTSFSITRTGSPAWGSVPVWRADRLLEITVVIQHILNLPALQNFHFSEPYGFQEPRFFHQLFRLTAPSNIRSLHLFGSHLLEKDDPSSSLVPALHQAKIKNIRVYYLDENPTGGLRLISSLTSPASPFDVTNLTSLELWAVDPVDDTWIPAILDAQKKGSTLEHLGLLKTRGNPNNEVFLQKLARFTSIRELSISEYNNALHVVHGTLVGSAAAWLSALPTNITSAVERILIHIEPSHYQDQELQGVDEVLYRSHSNMKEVILHLEEPGGEFDVEDFLQKEWYGCKDTELPSDSSEMTLRKWIATVILPKTYLEKRVDERSNWF